MKGIHVSEYKKGAVSASEKVAELERRDRLIRDKEADPGPLGIAGGSFADPQQHIVVFNIAGRGQRPIKDRPAVRILGVFETDPEALRYISKAGPLMKGCTLWKTALREWILISKTTARQQDGLYTSSKIEALKKLYFEDKKKRDAEFQKNRETKKQGTLNQSLEKQKELAKENRDKRRKKRSTRLQALKEKGNANPKNLHVAPQEDGTNNVPHELLQRKQDFFVASWLRDISKGAILQMDDPEPALIVWRFFADEDSARRWIKDTASHYVRDFDLEVLDTYEWLFPEDIDRSLMQESYRNPEQEKVLLASRQERQKVLDFEHWCKDKGVETPVVEVIGDRKSLDSLEFESPAVKMPLKSFEVKAETKNAGETLTLQQESEHDFAFVRKPVLPSGVSAPAPAGPITIHAPE